MFPILRIVGGLLMMTLTAPLMADSTEAHCEIYPRGEDHATQSAPCVFSQRQGHVTIRREDGVVYDLLPVEGQVGNFHDAAGRPVYRQSGLGSEGLIFRLPEETVFVYWQTTAESKDDDGNNPTYPYSTDNFDATTLLPCRSAASETFGSCPAGIQRMEAGEASIVVTSPGGEEFTLNFMRDYVNATAGRQVEAVLQGDTWQVTVDGADQYRVPLAAIEGG